MTSWRRWCAWPVVLVFVLSCGPQARPLARPADPNAARPLVVCPAGSVQVGAAPPHGRRVWCEDDEGLEHGPVVSYFADGRRKAEGHYAHGQLDGTWSFYDEHGRLRERREYVAGRPTGHAAQWFEGGARASETTYDDDGVAFVAWYRDGKKRIQGRHDDGQEHGVWTQWDEHGNVVTDAEPIPELPRVIDPAFEIDIAECERYVSGMLRCVESMPEAARDAMRKALAANVRAWQATAEEQRDVVVAACVRALDIARRSLQTCEFL